ncbi:hypothetical protein ACFYMI_16165 [Streptomyces collinus]|uniref:hypothetical protein n=1 Tax=Streptomyces collinus TaxID=42684 RepID=UPI0036824312
MSAPSARLRRTWSWPANDASGQDLRSADSLVEDFDVIDLLHRLSVCCVELLDVSAAGTLLADAHGELQTTSI